MKPAEFEDLDGDVLHIDPLGGGDDRVRVRLGSFRPFHLEARDVPTAAMALFEAAGLPVPDLLRQAVAPEDHVAAARQGLESADYSYQEWGRSEDAGYLTAVRHAQGSATVHALLAIAEAIEKSGGAA